MDKNQSQVGLTGGGLLDLATAVTGTPIDLNKIQILSKEWFVQFNEQLMLSATCLLEDLAPEEVFANGLPADGWRQEDGSLVVHFRLREGSKSVLVLPKDSWRELAEDEMSQVITQQEEEHGDLIGSIMEDLSVGLMLDINAQREKRKALLSLSGNIRQIVFVYDKHPTSLLALKDATKEIPDLKRITESWLSIDAEYLLVSTGHEEDMHWAMPVDDKDTLLDEVLPDVATERVNNIEETFIHAAWLKDQEVIIAIHQCWEPLGGIVPP